MQGKKERKYFAFFFWNVFGEGRSIIGRMKEREVGGQRARALLRCIVREYIRGGRPMGSRTLSRISGMNLSPATVRGAMAELESEGFLKSLHTSSGRVPSAKGFRHFVDHLLASRAPAPDGALIRKMGGELRGGNVGDVLSAAAGAMSQLTRLAGFAAAPRPVAAKIVRLRFVKLARRRALAAAVCEDGEIVHRVFESSAPLSERDLDAAAKFFNARFRRLTFDDACRRLRADIKNLRGRMSALLAEMLESAAELLPDDDGGLRLAGELNLLDQNELLADARRLRKLYALLSRKREFLDIIGRGGGGQEVRVFIGRECGHEALNDCSLVLSPFAAGGDDSAFGCLGVIGPKRMPYQHVIPAVGGAAQAVARALDSLRGGMPPALGDAPRY